MTKTKPQTTNYVDNSKLLEALRSYKNQVKEAEINQTEKPRVSNYIGKCVMLIAENLSRMPKFANYTFRDEMISDGIENVFQYIDNFNPEKYDKPFAYITKIVYYAFLRRIAREKKHLYVKYKSAANYGIFDAMTNTEAGSDSAPFEMYDNLALYIEEFETKRDAKKALPKKIQGIEKFVEIE